MADRSEAGRLYDPAAIKPRRAPLRARPQSPGVIAEQRTDPVGGQALFDGISVAGLSVFEPHQAVIRTGPQRAVGSFGQRGDAVTCKMRNRDEMNPVKTCQPSLE